MLSLSNISKKIGAQPALHPLTLRCASGTATALVGPKGAGKTTLLRLLVGQIPSDGGTVWMTLAPDPSRPFVQESFEISRNPSKWLKKVAFVPDALTGLQKFRYGTPAAMLSGMHALQPALLLLDEPLQAGTLANAVALQDLLASRRKKGLMTFVSTDDITDIALFDRILMLQAGKIQTVDTPESFAKKMSSPILAIATADLARLERDLPDFDGGVHFYRHQDAIRLRLDPAVFNTANTGIAVMSVTAWLAIKDHQQIAVRPVAPVLQDYLS